MTPPAGGAPGPGPRGLWRIRDRAGFETLRRAGRRRGSGPLDVVWVAGPPARPPRVAYSVGRGTGTAVVRNRVRRRLRAAVAEVAVGGGVAPGDYLVIARPGAADARFATLRGDVATACALSAGRPG